MVRDHLSSEAHRKSYMMNELESLGLTTIRLNEFNDAGELSSLVNRIKELLLKEYQDSLR